MQSDLEVGDSLGYEALALFRELDDQRGVGWTLIVLGGNAVARGDYGEGRRKPRTRTVALATNNFSVVRSCFLPASRVSRETELEPSACSATCSRARGAEDAAGETEQGRRSMEESIALLRGDARKPVLAIGLCNLGYLLRPNDPVDALAHFSESLALSREIEEPRTIAYCLEGGAGILAAASAIRALSGAVSSPQRRATADTLNAQCREALSDEAFARAWEEGVALDAIAAADWALRLWDETE